MDKIQQMFNIDEGGIWMILILLMSFICLGLIIERCICIFIIYNMNGKNFMSQIQKCVMSDSIDRALKLCNSQQRSALSRVIKAGLTKANGSELEVQNALEEASLEVVPDIMKRLPMLASMANLATLLGLLGTIIGLIDAFESLESAAPDKRQEMLSRGIALAMNTTAFGLIVAIPSLIFHALLSATSTKIIGDIELYSMKLGNMLASRTK